MSEPVIEANALVKKYGELAALRGIDLSVNKSEVFAFLGPNGAGKTTTVEILECLRDPTSGEAYVLGYDVRNPSDQKKIRKRIGVLPQDFNAMDRLTVEENLTFFGRMFEKHADLTYLLQLVSLEERRSTLFKNLSGGLKQKLGIAVSLVNDPDIVFLDEPTSGLDPRARREVWTVIKGLRDQGKTVFLTTHYMEEAQFLADNVAIIDNGSIVAEGNPEDLIAKHGGDRIVLLRGVGKEFGMKLTLDVPDAKVDGSDVVLPLTKHTDLMSIILAMKQGNVPMEGVEIKKPTLEDVFLNLTGRLLTEEGEAVRKE